MRFLKTTLATGGRAGVLTASDPNNANCKYGLLCSDVTFVRAIDEEQDGDDLFAYSTLMAQSHGKGKNRIDRRHVRHWPPHPFQRPENVPLEATVDIMALLILRSRLMDDETGEILDSVEAVLASRSARLVGVGDVPLYRNKSSSGGRWASEALSVGSLDGRLSKLASRLGMPFRPLYHLRDDFGKHALAMYGPAPTEMLMDHKQR